MLHNMYKIIKILCVFVFACAFLYGVQVPYALADEAEKYYEQGIAEQKKGNWELSFALLKHSAEKGYGRAQHELGVLYKNGQGIEKDEDQAAYWFGKAAEGGEHTAKNDLEEAYEKGKEGLSETVKAAGEGYESAKKNLGEYYEEGKESVKESSKDAASWTRETFDKGIDGVQRFLDGLKSE